MHKKKFKVSIVASEDDASLPAYEIEVFPEGAEEPEVQQHTVVDVTAKFLKKLKDTAEYFLGSSVDGCVISIPPHFSEKQKAALTKAAKTAGFSFSYALHEPVAAALAFNASIHQENDKADKDILVLDLGAESFNLSLISNHDGLYTIEESVEVPDLGGASFDKVLYEYAKDEFKKKTKMDISDNKRSVTKLLNACEVTKRSLSRQDTAPCFVESLYDGVDYNGSFMRGRFDLLAEPVYAKCKDAVLKFLEKQSTAPETLDQVLLIGGSSRMPRFQQIMKGLFPNAGSTTEFRTEVEPDEAIALGCAVQGTILEQDFSTNFDKKVIDAERLTKALGFQSADGTFVPVIPKGTPIPVRRSFVVDLAPGQTSVHLSVSESGEADGSSAEVLAEVGLAGIPADVKKGRVEIVFLIEADHILSVTLTEKVSGEKVHALLK